MWDKMVTGATGSKIGNLFRLSPLQAYGGALLILVGLLNFFTYLIPRFLTNLLLLAGGYLIIRCGMGNVARGPASVATAKPVPGSEERKKGVKPL